jgi:hypothetical protein
MTANSAFEPLEAKQMLKRFFGQDFVSGMVATKRWHCEMKCQCPEIWGVILNREQELEVVIIVCQLLVNPLL